MKGRKVKKTRLIRKKQFIENLKIGDSVSDVFLVRKIIPKDNLEVLICDKTGEIKITFTDKNLNRDDFINIIKPGDFIFIREGVVDDKNGEIKIYLNSLDNIERIDRENVRIEDLVPSLSNTEIESMLSELRDYIDSIDNVYLKSLLKKIFYDEEFMRNLLVSYFLATSCALIRHAFDVPPSPWGRLVLDFH